MNIPQELFNTLEQAVSTSEGKALYILVLICIAMILDFLLGSFAAWRDPQVKFTSQRGIDGILRKLASILVLVCCIPVSALVPAEAGLAPSSCFISAISFTSWLPSSKISSA